MGALRPFKFAIHLSSLGYKPVILTIGHKPDQLTPKEQLLLKPIEILSINSPFDRTSTANRTLTSDRLSKTRKEEKPSIKKYHFGEMIFSLIDRNCPIDTWIILFLIRWTWIKRVVKASKPDLIMATGDPWSGLWLGEKLSKYLKVPFIADFRDPWTLGNQRLRARSPFSDYFDKIVEKRVIEQADHLIFTSKRTHELYTNVYQIPSGNSTTIYNTFEPALISNNPSWNSPKMDHNKLNILFLGRFRRLSSASVLVEILNQIEFSNPNNLDLIRIHSFGEPDSDEIEQIQKAGLSDFFIYHPPFEPENSLRVMNSADLLLLSTSRERMEIIPAKLWDYLFSDVPILSIVPNPEVGEIIQRVDAGAHFSPENDSEIVEFLLNLIQRKYSGAEQILPIQKDRVGIVEFTSKAATEKLALIFDELLNRERG